jgi:hypothetical protein
MAKIWNDFSSQPGFGAADGASVVSPSSRATSDPQGAVMASPPGAEASAGTVQSLL